MGVYMCSTGKHIRFISVTPMQFFDCDCPPFTDQSWLVEGESQMDKNEVLQQIMKHAVTGHPQPTTGNPYIDQERTGYNSFCNDPKHANEILVANRFVVRQSFASKPEDVARAENEGMPIVLPDLPDLHN